MLHIFIGVYLVIAVGIALLTIHPLLGLLWCAWMALIWHLSSDGPVPVHREGRYNGACRHEAPGIACPLCGAGRALD